MGVSATRSRGLIRNKYIEYRRQYDEARNFSKHLDVSSKPEDSAKTASAKKPVETDSKPKNEALPPPENKTPVAQDTTPATVSHEISHPENLSVKPSLLTPANSTRMQRKLEPFKPYIRAAAARYDLPEELIAGFIWQESRGNPRAVSHCGAMGLMQLMPETAKNLGVTNAFSPAQNIDGGAKYIRQMLDKFGKLDHAVAAYNAGPGNVMKFGGIPPFRETQDYVPKVLGGAQSFKLAGGFMDTKIPTAVRV